MQLFKFKLPEMDALAERSFDDTRYLRLPNSRQMNVKKCILASCCSWVITWILKARLNHLYNAIMTTGSRPTVVAHQLGRMRVWVKCEVRVCEVVICEVCEVCSYWSATSREPRSLSILAVCVGRMKCSHDQSQLRMHPPSSQRPVGVNAATNVSVQWTATSST